MKMSGHAEVAREGQLADTTAAGAGDEFIDPTTRSGRLAVLCRRHEAKWERTTIDKPTGERTVRITLLLSNGERAVGEGVTMEQALIALEKRMETF